MAVTEEKLDVARRNFARTPCPETAALFLSILRELEENGVIDDDTFHNGLADVEAYLWTGGSVLNEEKFG